MLSQGLTRYQVLSSEEVRDAIVFGETETPHPYFLYHAPPLGSTENPTIVAALYTPFLRVAFAASAASQQGRSLSVADVPTSWLEPLVYVVVRGQFGQASADDPSPPQIRYVPPTYYNSPPLRLATPALFQKASRTGAGPVWERSVTTVLDSFGAMAPFENANVVAAFPIATLAPNGMFVIFRPDQRRNDGSGDIRIALVSLEARTTWR